MKLKRLNGKYYITNGGQTVILNSSAEAWQHIFDTYRKETKA